MHTYYIETFGCQMNKYDSELVASFLNDSGYQPAKSIETADIILINTCSVRDHAETRVKGKLDAFRALKKQKRQLIVGVLGCMAQRLGHELMEEKPIVDFVLGPDSYRRLPDVLARLRNDEMLFHDEYDELETYSDIYPTRVEQVSAWVAIMRGCNNFCSYCIVPYLRGRERSRKSQNILAEVQQLASEGYVEVTLLGQNVNSYHDGDWDFADLLFEVSTVPGIRRVRFATSHPKDVSPKLLETIGKNERICNHIHLAVQSGSNKILQLMNRHYTSEHFVDLIKQAREKIDNPGIYTDIIVGFPGETLNDFELTLALVEQVRFDGVFCFKYSPRSGTAAFQLAETVNPDEKTERLQQLIKLQKEIALQRNKELIGSVQEVLIEGPDKKRKLNTFMGRTGTNKIVIFSGNGDMIPGKLVDLKIMNAEGHTLFGEINK